MAKRFQKAVADGKSKNMCSMVPVIPGQIDRYTKAKIF
jgi:hypothetical protein